MDWSTKGWWRLRRTSSMKKAAMKLGNTPRPAAWSPPLASFSPPALILATRLSNSLPHLAAAVFWWGLLTRGWARFKHGGDVDGEFSSTKSTCYALVSIMICN
jgi:hypothetical protein